MFHRTEMYNTKYITYIIKKSYNPGCGLKHALHRAFVCVCVRTRVYVQVRFKSGVSYHTIIYNVLYSSMNFFSSECESCPPTSPTVSVGLLLWTVTRRGKNCRKSLSYCGFPCLCNAIMNIILFYHAQLYGHSNMSAGYIHSKIT